MTHIRDLLYLDVEAERLRQERLWGVQHHSPQKWLSILAEEFGEAAKAINEHDERGLRAEVLECCAVALAWAEDMDAHSFQAPLPPAEGERGRPKPTRQAV